MRGLLTLGGCGLLVLTLGSLTTPSVGASKKPTVEDQVVVLLKWYHVYFEEGKYKQAEQVAEMAHELAPDDPQAMAAVRVAHRQQINAATSIDVEQKLEKVLKKLDRIERQLYELETEKDRRSRISLSKEPPGSPDRPE